MKPNLAEPKGKIYKTRYGLDFDARASDLQIEMWCFLFHNKSGAERHSDQSRYYHYRNLHASLWPKHEEYFNEWMDRMQYAFCTEPHVTMTACGGAGKTTEMAKYSLLWWRAPVFAGPLTGKPPIPSIVAATSTTLALAKIRIFGQIIQCAAESEIGQDAWGHFANSNGIIRRDQNNDLISIKIIPGGSVEEAEGKERLKGWHAPRALICLDELQDIMSGIVNGCLNLSMSTTEFQLLAAGNGTSWFDQLGTMMTPEKGVSTVSTEDDIWRTRKGKVLHFSAFRSPNLARSKENQIPYLPTQAQIVAKIEEYGEDSLQAWQMLHGFPNPGGSKDCIISEQAFANSNCMEEAVWEGPTTTIGACDPAYGGGDRCVLRLALEGKNIFGVINIEMQPPIIIQTKQSDPMPVEFQIAHEIHRICSPIMKPEDFAIDSTAQGKAVLYKLREIWGNVEGVEFGGLPSDMPLDPTTSKTAKEEYLTKTGELCHTLRRFLDSNQLRGMDMDTIKEGSSRRFCIQNKKIWVEPKDVVKKRIGRSPDLFDTAMLVVHVARRRSTLAQKKRKGNSYYDNAIKAQRIYNEEDAYSGGE